MLREDLDQLTGSVTDITQASNVQSCLWSVLEQRQIPTQHTDVSVSNPWGNPSKLCIDLAWLLRHVNAVHVQGALMHCSEIYHSE